MWTPRRRKGFEPAGTVGPAGLGLRKASAKRFRIALAWREIAGRVLDEQTAVSVTRGLLDVVAHCPEARSLIEPVLPQIASRIADRYPELEVRRWRLRVSGEDGAQVASSPVEPLHETPGDTVPTAPTRQAPRRSGPTTNEAPATDVLLRRLESAGRRYLARQDRDPSPD